MKVKVLSQFIIASLTAASTLSLTSCFKDEPLNAECDIEQAYIHPGPLLKLWFANAADTLVNVQSDQDKIEFTMRPFAILSRQAPMFQLTPGATIQPKAEAYTISPKVLLHTWLHQKTSNGPAPIR